jgi:fatty acid desaturase
MAPLPPSHTPVRGITAADLRTLREAIDREGLLAPTEAWSWAKAGVLAAAFLGLLAALSVGPGWLAVPLLPVMAGVMVVLAMLGHEGGHRSFSSVPWRNTLLYHLTFPFLGGLSALYWRDKHNVKHHGHPNVLGEDHDIQLWPMVTSSAHHAEAGRFLRWFQRHFNGIAFWPLTAFLTWEIRWDSFRHLLSHAKTRGMDRAWWLDAGSILAHYGLWLGLPLLWFGVLPTLGFYVALWSLVGMFLSAVFASAHMGLPITVGRAGDPWLQQLETTRDLGMPRWLSWCFVGLDHQIEHHLFPKMAHRHLPRAAVIVRAWAEERNLPYFKLPYSAALVELTRYLHRGWKIDPVPSNGMAPAGVEKAA